MSFGLEMVGSGGRVQINSENAIYECIFSGTGTGEVKINGLRDTDIVAFTYLSGGYTGKLGGSAQSGGVYDHFRDERNIYHNHLLFGKHRIVVFRPSTSVGRRAHSFGIQIRDAKGTVVFDTLGTVMSINPNAAYKAVVYQGQSTSRVAGSSSLLTLYIHTTYITPTGSLRSAKHRGGTWSVNFNEPPIFLLDAPPVIVDVSQIPLNFSLGLIYLSAGVELLPGTDTSN